MVYMFTQHSVVVCKMCPHYCFQSQMVGVVHHVPQVEERLRNAEEELATTKQQLEEKIRKRSALMQKEKYTLSNHSLSARPL